MPPDHASLAGLAGKHPDYMNGCSTVCWLSGFPFSRLKYNRPRTTTSSRRNQLGGLSVHANEMRCLSMSPYAEYSRARRISSVSALPPTATGTPFSTAA